MSAIPSVLGLKKALTIHTGNGDVGIDPEQDPLGYKQLLGQSLDERVRTQRAAADAVAPPDMGTQIARSAEDGATGPAGWNRNWAEFGEVPRVLEDNTGATYKPAYSTMGNRLAGLSVKRQKGTVV